MSLHWYDYTLAVLFLACYFYLIAFICCCFSGGELCVVGKERFANWMGVGSTKPKYKEGEYD